MLNTVRAVVREGKIELLEPVDLPEGTTVLVTLLMEEDTLFWSRVSHLALDTIWDNAEDDVYAQLLQKRGNLGALSLLRLVWRVSSPRGHRECSPRVARRLHRAAD